LNTLSGGFGKPERRDFTDYFSIQDRYSARPDFDSKNTIGGRFRVNRAERLGASFLIECGDSATVANWRQL
ncbi:MAG: hypothetical protein ACREFK_10370, partial [Stellaceae bacterium]